MIPVEQTRHGGPGEPDEGNCFAAALASILELPLVYVDERLGRPRSDVPIDDVWIAAFQAFLGGMKKDGEVVWDPSPARDTGKRGRPTDIMLFQVLDPSQPVVIPR